MEQEEFPKLPQEELWKRINAVSRYMHANWPKTAMTMEVRWLLACSAMGEKHPDVVRYGRGII
jgi:hypothetical protein